MRKPDGGPAFPSSMEGGVEVLKGEPPLFGVINSPGMTLRDWLAGQALAGSNWTQWRAHMPGSGPNVNGDIATFCYALADAVLAERSKRDES